MRNYDQTHWSGKNRTYDEIINALLDNNQEEPNFLKWNLSNTDKFILYCINKGNHETRKIRNCLEKKGITISMRAIQEHMEKLVQKNLILKEQNGKEYTYILNGKVIK